MLVDGLDSIPVHFHLVNNHVNGSDGIWVDHHLQRLLCLLGKLFRLSALLET
jgi:hypothetical protein